MAGRDEQGRGDKTQLLQQANWAGGINTASQAEELLPNEAQDIENFKYDSDDNLVSRSGVAQFIGATTYATRLTSLFRYVASDGTVRILWTEDNDINRSDENGGSITDITGGLTLPTDTFWQWKTFTGFAIGVNKGTGANTNPVKVLDGNNAVALGGSPPKAKYIEIWNNRVWLVDAVNSNRIHGSALGNAEDWTTTGAAGRIIIDIDPGDGDQITGIVAFRERLFIFKRRRIYVISATANPVTDPANLRVDIFTSNIGCFSPYSIQPVLNDVLFLSDSGVASLAQSEFGELQSALLSTKVAELAEIKKNTDEIGSMVLDDENQYWLSIPATSSPRLVAETYVFHYDKIAEGFRRWTRFTGKITGTAFSEKLNTNFKQYLIAYREGAVNTIYVYSPTAEIPAFNDAGAAYNRVIKTKAYSADVPLLRKDWVRMGFGVRLLTPLLNLSVAYFFDNVETKGSSFPFSFTFNQPNVLIWDVGEWDEQFWAGDSARDEYIWRKFKKISLGRRGMTVTFVFSNNTADQAYVLKYLASEYALLGHRRVKTI